MNPRLIMENYTFYKLDGVRKYYKRKGFNPKED